MQWGQPAWTEPGSGTEMDGPQQAVEDGQAERLKTPTSPSAPGEQEASAEAPSVGVGRWGPLRAGHSCVLFSTLSATGKGAGKLGQKHACGLEARAAQGRRPSGAEGRGWARWVRGGWEKGLGTGLRTRTVDKGSFCRDFRAETGILTGHQQVK